MNYFSNLTRLPKALTLCAGVFLSGVANFVASLEESKPLPLHIGGRVLVDKTPQGEQRYRYSWPSIYFETAFEGTSLSLRFDDDQNYFQLYIDNKTPIWIKKPGKQNYLIRELPHGVHHIRLEKTTETINTSGTFLGFYSSGKALELPRRQRSIEFIGDSHTVGYANTSAKRNCASSEVFDTTNSQLAFAPLTAKYFNADYQVNAASGFGAVRNYNGSNPETSLIARYPFLLNTPFYIYQAKWQPQVYVINLGNNDFSTKLKADEPWQTRAALQADYVEKYTHFVNALYRANRKAYFVLLSEDSAGDELPNQIQRVIEQLHNQGIKRVTQLVFKNMDLKACHWHPSSRDHREVSSALIALLESKPIW